MFKILDLNSIRSRMISGFLFLTFLILIVTIVSLLLLDRTNRQADIHGQIGQLQIHTLLLFKNDNDFFDLESTNENYFKTHESKYLTARKELLHQVEKRLEHVLLVTNSQRQAIDKDLLLIDSALKIYNTKFLQLEELIFQKGLKDYGLEGSMRVHAHKLEEEPAFNLDMADVLSLRRHEKDFFLRLDTTYVTKFLQRTDNLLAEVGRNKGGNQQEIFHLQEYRNIFLELVALHKQIGLTSSSGLRNELNELTFLISDRYLDLSTYSYILSSKAQQQARFFYTILMASAIVFSLLSGLWISRKLSAPIAVLSKQVRNANQSGQRIDYDLKNGAREIQTLARAFNQMLEKSDGQMTEIKAKSKALKKKNKELKRVNKELDNFLYSTAHDLRSPLTSLLGLINLFAYETERSNIDSYILMMKESVGRMEGFIEQIVSYSKNKNLEATIERIELGKLIDNIIESHKFMGHHHRIRWVITRNEAVPVFSEQRRVTIILNNLISNAIKYTDPQKADSFIRIRIQSNSETFSIEFEDNGIGIGQEHVDRVFDMFYRANFHSKGSGLGLYIVKQTIERLKGSVHVESVLGEGTKFFIRLPNQISERHSEYTELVGISS